MEGAIEILAMIHKAALLAMIQNVARRHVGDSQWKPFFSMLGKFAFEGEGTRDPEDSFMWRDDGATRHLVQPDSLLHYCSNVWSQRGDDGIVRRIFTLLGIDKGFFVEFGAWDGIFLCNTRALAQRGWSGCFIEASPEKFQELRQNYVDRSDIHCVQAFVVPTPSPAGRTLEEVATAHFPGRDIDFLSIDIDGLDYLVLESLTLRPKVVCIEGGFSWHPEFTKRVPDEVADQNLQQPLAVLCEIAKGKGYTPVCFNQNTFLVADELAAPFRDIVKDPVTLWRDGWFNETEVFRRNLTEFRRNPVIRAQEGMDFERLDF